VRDPFFTLDSYAQLVTLRLPLRVHNQTVKRRTKYRVEIIADILTRIIKIDSHKKPCSQESRQIIKITSMEFANPEPTSN